MSEPTLIGEIVVSKDPRLKARVDRRGGRGLVDLRLFRQGETMSSHDVPTKSGFAMQGHSVGALITLLEMAETRKG